MPDVGLAVSGWRPVIEIETLAAFVLLDAFFEYLVLLPEREDFLFALNEIQRSVNGFVHYLPLITIKLRKLYIRARENATEIAPMFSILRKERAES